MKTRVGLRETLGFCTRLFSILAAVSILLITALTTADVVLRSTVKHGIPSSYEISGILLSLMVFLGIAYAQRIKSFIRVDILTSHLPPRAVPYTEMLALVAMFILFALIAWLGARRAVTSFAMGEHTGGVVAVPLYPARFVLVVGCVLICLQIVADVTDLIRGWSARQVPQATKEHLA